MDITYHDPNEYATFQQRRQWPTRWQCRRLRYFTINDYITDASKYSTYSIFRTCFKSQRGFDLSHRFDLKGLKITSLLNLYDPNSWRVWRWTASPFVRACVLAVETSYAITGSACGFSWLYTWGRSNRTSCSVCPVWCSGSMRGVKILASEMDFYFLETIWCCCCIW